MVGWPVALSIRERCLGRIVVDLPRFTRMKLTPIRLSTESELGSVERDIEREPISIGDEKRIIDYPPLKRNFLYFWNSNFWENSQNESNEEKRFILTSLCALLSFCNKRISRMKRERERSI